jgi:lipid-A-disaccharide synthase
MRSVAEQMVGHGRVTGFLLPTPRSLEARVRAEVAGWSAPVEVITGEAAKADAFARAVAAVAVTGTVTLELALAGVPMVTTYVADKGQAKRWVQYKVKFASLPNVIVDRTLVPEVLQVEADPAPLVAALTALLDVEAAAGAQLEGFAEIRTLMQNGAPEAPRVDPAGRVLRYLKA